MSPSPSKRSFRRLRLGYEIVAIDPQGPGGEIFERISLEEFTDSGPFDAVLANSAR